MRTRAAAGVIAFVAGGALAHVVPHGERPPPTKPVATPHFAKTFRASRFVRGNVHTHTNRSDGDASPADVTRWYRDHGYGFLALTDHNLLSEPSTIPAGATPDLTRIAGEEVSMWVRGKQVHVNALCTHSVVGGGVFPDAKEALSHAVDAIHAQGGVALINHPNFDWALDADDILSADGADLLEIASGHPYVHSAGDATHPSHEQLWDDALTAGHDMMAVAVDDTHHLVTDADPEAFPGVAWAMVFADEPRGDVVCDALRRGALYASTGAVVRGIDVSREVYEVDPGDPDATVVFVGAHGRVLARVTEAQDRARYRLVGDEGYVRARVEAAEGNAWTPAVRVVPARMR
jgi:hypothetical protein